MIDPDSRANAPRATGRNASAMIADSSGVDTLVVEHADSRPVCTPALANSTTDEEGARLGYAFAKCVLVCGAALSLIAVADALSRSGRSGGETLFWIALIAPIAIAAYYLTLPQLRRSERLAIVVTIGLTLYLVKVLQNPFTFLYTDELIHAFNAQRVLDTKSLFSDNPLLPVTPNYPGLSSITSAVASLTGLHVFGAGLFVIGAARVMLLVGLFLLFEEVTRSARIAGLATLVYAAHPNFLFWVSQFAYESLALPLAVIAVVGVARWMRADTAELHQRWAVIALVLISAVIVTHHMTSYGLVAFLTAVWLVSVWFTRSPRSPWPFAAFAAVATVGWLIVVASETVGYLKPVFLKAVESTVDAVSREGGGRKLFESQGGVETPYLERVVALSSVGLIALTMPFALRAVWRRYRTSPFVLVFALAATAYLAMFLVRFVPRAWEIGNRASEFLFIGVALMLALAWTAFLERVRWTVVRWAVTGAVALVFAGGVIAGWERELRLSLPYRVSAHGQVFEPPGSVAARWSRANLSAPRVAADESSARLMLGQGVWALADTNPPIARVIETARLDPWMVDVLKDNRLDYVVMDRRVGRDHPTVGYFFTSGRTTRQGFHPRRWYEKLDRQPGVSRIFDSGDIVIYSLKRMRYDPDFP